MNQLSSTDPIWVENSEWSTWEFQLWSDFISNVELLTYVLNLMHKLLKFIFTCKHFRPLDIMKMNWARLIKFDVSYLARRYEISLWLLKNSEIFFLHEKINFVSPSGHVMFYLLYKHQWNTKPFHFNSFLVWKARFIM